MLLSTATHFDQAFDLCVMSCRLQRLYCLFAISHRKKRNRGSCWKKKSHCAPFGATLPTVKISAPQSKCAAVRQTDRTSCLSSPVSKFSMESVDCTYQQYLPGWLFNTAPSLDFLNCNQTSIKSKVYYFIIKCHLYRKFNWGWARSLNLS